MPGDDYDDALFENPGGHGNNWISLRLVGVKTNRAGHRRADPRARCAAAGAGSRCATAR